MLDFRKIISDLLNDSGHTQTELAHYLGIKSQTVSHWINGRATPTFDKLEPIAHFFHLSVPELLGDTPPGDIPSPSLVFTVGASEIAQIAPGSDVRVELRTRPEIGDVVLYKSGDNARLLRLAAYRDGISVLMSDKPGDAPVISRDSDEEIVGTATAILLKKAKKEPAPVGVSGADSAENKDKSNNLLYHENMETSNYEDKKI